MSAVLRVGMVGAGVMARAHSLALVGLTALFPDLPLKPRLVAVADVNEVLADEVSARFGYERVEAAWQQLVEAADVDLVCICVPPLLNPEVVRAAARAGKHVVCEKPLAPTAAVAEQLLGECENARVFHGLGLGYRWSSALRAIRQLVMDGELGEIRHLRLSFLLDYAADERTPLVWRFRRDLAGGGLALDTGYHLVDCVRFLAGEVTEVCALTETFVRERPWPTANAFGNDGMGVSGAAGPLGKVDVEDAAAALVRLDSGAYGVLETSRVARGKRIALEIDVFGARGSASWNLERPDEFELLLPTADANPGFRRVLVNTSHPGAANLLVAGADGTSVGWLGLQCAMWAEFVSAIAERREAAANFRDGVAANAVVDAIYKAADSGAWTAVARSFSGSRGERPEELRR